MLAVIQFLGLTGLLAVAAYVAVTWGLSYLGGKLFAPEMPEADIGVTPDAQSRSWNPHSTQQEGIARPRAYGKNMHHGNIVMKWTGIVDNREKLYLIVEHCDGPTKGVVEVDGVKQVFLNDQPLSNFTSVDVQERFGTLNQTCMTGFDKPKLEHELDNPLLLNEPITFTTPNDFFDDLEYTLLWPGGLRRYHKSGGMDWSGCGIKVRIRVHPAGEWHIIFNEPIFGVQTNPLFKLYKVNEQLAALELDPLERGKQYDLEVTNTTGPAERHVNDVTIRSVREVIDVAFTYPGKALVGIRAVATEHLHGRLDVKVIREDKLIRVWDGTTWTIKYSRNRAWVTYDAFTQPVISGDGNSGGDFEVKFYEGISPAHMDLTFFYNWAEFCSAQVQDGYGGTEDRIACDTILDFHTSVWEFAQEIANVGRASLYWRGHVLTGWIDKAVNEIAGLVTMDNTMARSWKNAWAEKDELAGKAEVFFQDSRQGYERMPATLSNESAGRYTRIVSIEGVGITTRGTAIHLANHLLKRNELIRNINNFRQAREAFRYHLGEVIRLQCKVPDWGESYRVRSSSANNKVKLDRTCTAEAGELLWLQSYDEALKKVRTNSYTILSVADKVVTITTTWEVTPKKNYMVATGVDGDIKKRRIIKMDVTANNYWDITVETYDANLFTADDMVPDNPDQNYIWSKPACPLTRPVTREEVIEMINTMAVPQLSFDIPWTSNCTWTGSGGDTVSWSKTDATEPIIFRYKGIAYEITLGDFSTTDTYIYWDPAQSTSFRHTNDNTVALAPGCWIVCTNTAGVAHSAIPIQLLHGGIVQLGTLTAAQIIISGINALGLMNAPAEAGADKTGSHQGDISLANLNEKSVDSLVDGTFAKMLAVWRKTGHLTFIDGGKIYTGSILADAIATYALTAANATLENLIVKTAHIDDLNVTTLKIANWATTKPVSAYTAGASAVGTGWSTKQSIEITTTGLPVHITGSLQLNAVAGPAPLCDVCIRRGGSNIYEANDLHTVWPGTVPFSAAVSDAPSAGTYIYTLEAKADLAGKINAVARSLVAEEFKK